MPPGGSFFASRLHCNGICRRNATVSRQRMLTAINELQQLIVRIRPWTDGEGAPRRRPSSTRPVGEASSGGSLKDGNDVSNLEVQK